MEQRIVQRLVCGRSAQGRALALVHTSTSILSSRFHFHTVKDTVLLFFLQLLVLAVRHEQMSDPQILNNC